MGDRSLELALLAAENVFARVPASGEASRRGDDGTDAAMVA
jgi:hypothetical protein